MADSAKAPWKRDDSDDGPTFIGMNFSDPAHQIDTHLNGLGTFSHNYKNMKPQSMVWKSKSSLCMPRTCQPVILKITCEIFMA